MLRDLIDDDDRRLIAHHGRECLFARCCPFFVRPAECAVCRGAELGTELG